MRIISQDLTRSIPYEESAMFIRIRNYTDDTITFVITMAYSGVEYDMAYYSNEDIAKAVFQATTFYKIDSMYNDDDELLPGEYFDKEGERQIDFLILPDEKDVIIADNYEE